MLERLATKICTSLQTSWVFSSQHIQLHHIHIDIKNCITQAVFMTEVAEYKESRIR